MDDFEEKISQREKLMQEQKQRETQFDLSVLEDRIPEAWGKWISCDAGWWPLLLELNEKLSALMPTYQICQIKEKFGGLRFYIDYPENTDEETIVASEALIRAAELEAEKTCEYCGETGAPSKNKTWYKTVCVKHAELLDFVKLSER